jgi:ribonuclease HII
LKNRKEVPRPASPGTARTDPLVERRGQQNLWESDGDLFRVERELRRRGFQHIAGIDEAGRGPLAGPVVAAAAVLSPEACYEGLTDSKLLTPRAREIWFDRICASAVDYAIASVGHEEIDAINILVASRKAMELAVGGLSRRPDHLLVDGIIPIQSSIEQWCIKQGDRRSFSIAAASVLAKVTRDRLMDDLHHRYPQYNFRKNKGYGTHEHREALQKFGFCPLHRKTFRGVKEILAAPPACAPDAEPLLQEEAS